MRQLLTKFIGGIKVPDFKKASTQCPVVPAAIPQELVLPLHQHIGSEPEPIVSVGDRVLKGQKLARAMDYVCAPVHAPTSGVVTAIERRPVPHPSGLSAMCIVMQSDGKDEWCELKVLGEDYKTLDPSVLRNRIREAGIVGLGGAGFPSYIKLNPGVEKRVETLIINGAECEPYITCDDMLMRERADEVVKGALIIGHALRVKQIIIAIEGNKPEAIRSVETAAEEFGRKHIEVLAVPAIYPAGGEKQLVHTVTGKQIPSDGLPIQVGVVCQNVGTTAAIFRAVQLGEPLISRYVTVAGDVEQPRNFEVLFGTPMNELVHQAGGYVGQVQRMIVGGPLMGFAVHAEHLPVIKTTNCVLVDCGGDNGLSRRGTVMPCIRCGACTDVCPIRLLPQQMYWHTKGAEFDRLSEYDLFDCIECGCCDYVCPAQIPLVQYYRYAKAEVWQRERERQKSDMARERHEFRQLRIEREKAERAEKHKKRMHALKDEPKASSEDAPKEDPKKAAILAAMERAKAKKDLHKAAPKNTDNLTEAQQKKIAEIDARRAQARSEESTASGQKNVDDEQ